VVGGKYLPGVLGCACATRCASHNPRRLTSGGVANSFVKTVVSNFVCKSETNEKIPPPPLFTSRLVKKSVSPEWHQVPCISRCMDKQSPASVKQS
jgi:hypothetical protein